MMFCLFIFLCFPQRLKNLLQEAAAYVFSFLRLILTQLVQ